MPFVLNKAQHYLHQRLEDQLHRTGMVRAVICKGRQEGCTTYIQGRFFHKTQVKQNQRAFILAHKADSTDAIYEMARRFHRNLPEGFRVELTKDNERTMETAGGSKYSVGTAESESVGRGTTVQLFHGSETAFYPRTDNISTGVLQAVADMPGTELILESTANGMGNWFHAMVQTARAGKGGFILIFIPWYWMDEYKVFPGIPLDQLDDNELRLYNEYKHDGLTLEHLAWRRRKIESLDGKEWKFRQEYPFNVDDAFVTSTERFYDIDKVYAAKNRWTVTSHSDRDVYPLIIGVDQGRTHDDTKISRRVGPMLLPFQTIKSESGLSAMGRSMRLAGILAKIIDDEIPEAVFIDTTNEHGALDRLWELGYKKIVKGVHFGEKASDPKRYRNKRVEMHVLSRDWFLDEETVIPPDELFLTEIGVIPREETTSNSVMYLISKDDIREKLGWSPDTLDSFLLTFAYPVRKKEFRTMRERRVAIQQNRVNAYVSTLRTLDPVQRKGVLNGVV